MTIRLLAHLLHLANADVPYIGRDEFYAIKERILRQWGTRAGDDWQHIRKECWTCDGTGTYCHEYHGPIRCNRCTKGVYDEKWIRLERWTLGRYVFHCPKEKRHSPPACVNLIEDHIDHTRPGHRGHEAALWLALFFDPPYWLRLLKSTRLLAWTGLPMCSLQWLVSTVCAWAESFTVRDCMTCGYPFVRPMTGSIHFQCRPCAQKQRIRVWSEDEIPF